jgi:hypothetical protein
MGSKGLYVLRLLILRGIRYVQAYGCHELERTEVILRLDILEKSGTRYWRAGGLLYSLWAVSTEEDEYIDIYSRLDNDIDQNGR